MTRQAGIELRQQPLLPAISQLQLFVITFVCLNDVHRPEYTTKQSKTTTQTKTEEEEKT